MKRLETDSNLRTDRGRSIVIKFIFYKSSSKGTREENGSAWPKISDLSLWKANLIQAVVIATNGLDQKDWIEWIKQPLVLIQTCTGLGRREV